MGAACITHPVFMFCVAIWCSCNRSTAPDSAPLQTRSRWMLPSVKVVWTDFNAAMATAMVLTDWHRTMQPMETWVPHNHMNASQRPTTHLQLCGVGILLCVLSPCHGCNVVGWRCRHGAHKWQPAGQWCRRLQQHEGGLLAPTTGECGPQPSWVPS